MPSPCSPKARRLMPCLEVRVELAKDEESLLAELIVRFAVNAVTELPNVYMFQKSPSENLVFHIH